MKVSCRHANIEQVSNSTEWLKEFYSNATGGKRINLYDPKYRPIHDFMFIWNIFERDVLNKKTEGTPVFHQKDIGRFADSYIPSQIPIESFFGFIKNRYVDSEDGKLRFSHLEINNEDATIWDMLNKSVPTLQDKNHVCLIVAWRYRNNLFHGNKIPAEIIEQSELFNKTNEYLISYIEWAKEPAVTIGER